MAPTRLAVADVRTATGKQIVSGEPLHLDVSCELVEAIAQRAVEILAERQAAADQDQWLDSGGAADYLGLTRNALHKLTSSRAIPFEQDAPGCKLYFRRSELDRWRRGGRSLR